jgi:glycosyltransferase involved in cell wall biosynthesis
VGIPIASSAKRVLLLTHTYHPEIGGGVRYKKAVVDHLRSLGCTVDVLALSPDRRCHVVRQAAGDLFRVPSAFTFKSTRIAPAYLREFGRIGASYDLLLFNFPSPMSELAFLVHRARLGSVRKVCMYHGDIVPEKPFAAPYNTFVTRPFLSGMDALIVSSRELWRSSPHLAPFERKTHVIPFGVDPERFTRSNASRLPSRSNAELRLLFAGRLVPHKGLEHLLRAIQRAPGSLRIAGDGPELEPLRALAAALGLGERVTFLGMLDDERLTAEYHATDVLVLPSLRETFGYVLVEAMMCSAAVISTELGTGTSFVNVHGETGYVVPPGDPQAISRALLELDQDRARLRAFQQAARRRSLAEFTLDRMVRETTAVLLEGGGT